jgi:Kae1-associated kinase Bud32
MPSSFKILKQIYEGAEAKLFLILLDSKKYILKQRIDKNYRVKKLNDKIIKFRIRRESKILEKVGKLKLKVPKVKETNLAEKQIIMEFIDAKGLINYIPKDKNLLKKLAKDIVKLHNNNIIHGDITLENILYDPKTKKNILIDFGLAFESHKIEDFATDLAVFKSSLTADFSEDHWDLFLNEYLKKTIHPTIKTQLEKVEKRKKYN